MLGLKGIEVIDMCGSLIPPLYSLLLETSMHACMINQCCVAVDFRTTHSCYSLCLGTLLIDGGGVKGGGEVRQTPTTPKGMRCTGGNQFETTVMFSAL